MNYKVQINNVESIDEIPNYWTTNDYEQLLPLFNFADFKSVKIENLLEMLQMAIADFEPSEAALILLHYKLSEDLNEGQMDQLSNDMLLDKISEEYPNIALHYKLFNINQLLFKAFNGTFLNTKATSLKFTITNNEDNTEFTKSQILKIVSKGLRSSNLILRLFEEQLMATGEFLDAENIIWELTTNDNINFELITSEYWLSRDDLAFTAFEAVVEEELAE